MAEVILKQVTKRFQNTVALDNVDLKIEDGEFFTLLGPSGCGKTTTLRSIAGLEKPTSGNIFIGGRDVTSLSPKERHVAMVFQNYALYPHMTVAQNIGYPLKIRGYSPQEIRARVEEVAESLQISSLLARKPAQISGGQQQRVALARAIIHKPDVFLFDEPLSNLDAKLRADARTFLKRFQQELQITTIYVTHDQTEAMAMSDRIAVMERGFVRQVGRPRDVYHHPASVFVADFIGNPPMNLMECTIRGAGDGYGVEFSGVFLKLPGLGRQSRLVAGSRATLGVRPENLSVRLTADPAAGPPAVDSAPVGGRVSLPGEVFVVEPLGSETLVTVKAAEMVLKVKIFGDMALAPGARATVDFAPDKVHIFDGEGNLVA